MSQHEFLLEIGTEEIPDWMIAGALGDLEKRFFDALAKNELADGVTCRCDATPRRLVLVAEGLAERQADRKETLKGPPKNVAFDSEGKPTKAAEGFAKRAGVSLDAVTIGDDNKLTVQRTVVGRATTGILAEVLPEVIIGIYFPKTMYWTAKNGPRFIRPVRWLVALFDGKVIDFEIAGVRSGNCTHGHRRLGSANLEVTSAADFREKLAANSVILSAEERRRKIESGIAEMLPSGFRARPNPKLLSTLVNITEFPTPVFGEFDASYLTLPEEVLETVMEHHQKYFAVEQENGKLAARFIAVSNLDGDPDGIIRQGHERVLRARFNDAHFFWDFDQRRRLAERMEDLKVVTFQAQLGSYHDKTERNVKLVDAICGLLNLDSETRAHARRAVELAKCDLTTEMVGEFPELQGIVGGLYAKYQGEPAEVGDGIYGHYLPAGADDPIPTTLAAKIVALADKLDTLGGMFRLGMAPTSSKDPFALRRSAYGIIRILLEGNLALSISSLCEIAEPGEHTQTLTDFFVDRLRYALRDARGYLYDEVNAVLAASSDEPLDAAARAEAISRVRPTPDFEPLAVSFKRIKNILRQAGGVEQFAARNIDPALLEDGAERDLHAAFEKLAPTVAAHKEKGEYAEALTTIASLRPAVDLFFDKVLVMAEQEEVRNNRLALLAHILSEFSTIADFAEIVSA